MYKKFFLAFLLLTSINLFSQDDEDSCSRLKSYRSIYFEDDNITRNQQDFDVKYYDIDLNINVSNESINGTLGILLTSLVDGLGYIELDFISGMNVSNITLLDGSALSFLHDDQHMLTINLDSEINSDENIHLIIHYNGSPEATGFGSFGFDSYQGYPMIWTLSEPYGSRDWWPCKDTPSDKADSVDISITVPENLTVASNGLLDSVVEVDNLKTYHWKERYPIATYLVSLAIYPYTHFTDYFVYGESDTMNLEHYVYPNHFNLVQSNYALTVDMLEGFSERFGLYPFIDEKYGHAEFVWGGGMEHQTLTSMGGYSQHLISHELGHQWWGDMVTCANFHHIWLNEGFATYSQAMWWEIRDNNIQSLHSQMASKAYYGGGTIFVSDTTSVGNIFSSNLVYNKASWVMHMLRHILGDTAFFGGLREYGDQYRFDSAVTDDFREVMESYSGQDLSAFFQRWIYGEFYPIYTSDPQYYTTDNNTSFIQVNLSQTQSSPIFAMPVDIRITTDLLIDTRIADQTIREQVFSYIVTGIPSDVEVDPDNWVLKSANDGMIQFIDHIALGDQNLDGNLDVLDIVQSVNLILSPVEIELFDIWITDINGDVALDVLDLVMMINMILG
ncbi:MAG: hypothetical protein HN729_05620 [Candidatus Marinimicrobia bacterium]|jgi:aminopeptidase N|nr:hypothetical protein [Candidatus Neomarinimicrobiota bacterium]MBT3634346.1 hypothetical protein [Candidatus Neomarinimicrobiota bacterium]MBT3681745.1 hypothetical protein [Candidatus Neomarinimicrobiota bacterium]MBT3759471.1 hypothetical protein [Candidatus Neomarinimicrobiota bacterium]MBT3895959.1 hypothetical protein [Candidatus Neomarinimicrobiota bacterium]